MKNILIIARKDLASFFNSPVAYIVAVVFLLASYFMFWQSALITGEASMRDFFNLWPWYLLILVPAITMRSLSDEKRRQTMDLLLVHPIKEWQVVVGKFLGCWGYLSGLLAISLTLPVTLMIFSSPDLGQIFGQYIGGLLVGAGFIAVGVMISAWVDNVISSFLLTAGLIFIWLLLGLDIVIQSFPDLVSSVLQVVAILSHVEQMARGLLTVRDVIFFVVVVGLALMVATIKLMEPKTVENPARRIQLYMAALMLFAIGVVTNMILQAWPMRIDMTQNQMFTLSSATRETLGDLDDIVSITFYVSDQLPTPVQVNRQLIEDTLDDYVKFGHGKVKLSVVAPESDDTLTQKAIEDGVQQIQFNTMAEGRFAVESGFMGMVISYGDESESIGFVSDTSNLEYDLTRRIRKLTNDTPHTIGIATGHGEKSEFVDFSTVAETLRTEYDLTGVDLSDSEATVSADLVMVVGPTEPLDSTGSANLEKYLSDGGSALLLLDQVQPNFQLGIASLVDTGYQPLLDTYGIRLNQDMAYDARLNQNISIGNGVLSYVLPYPYWINALTNKQFDPVANLDGVTLGWASSISLNGVEGVSQQPLLHTSKSGGVTSGTLNIDPKNAPKQGQDEEVLLGVLAEKSDSKLAVVGDADFMLNDFAENQDVNVAFLSNLIDYLTTPEGQLTVPRKDLTPAMLQFGSATEVNVARWGNIVGVPIAVAIFGVWWLRRRKSRTNRVYQVN